MGVATTTPTTMEGAAGEEKATKVKRKSSQVDHEPVVCPVPAALLNRRRGAISFAEPPEQLQQLVERMAKRAKFS